MSYSSEVLADSPLFWARLGEASGTTLTDSSGNGRNGIYANAMTLNQTGAITDGDKAITPSSASSYGKVTGASWMNVTSWTAEIWVNRGASSSYGYSFTREAGLGQTVASDYIWSIRVNSSGKAEVVIFKGGSAVFVTGSATLAANTWYHIAATLSGSTLTLYVNGVSAGSNSAGGTISTSSATDMVVANVSTTGAGNLSSATPGYIFDEAAFYGTALTSTRLLAHYNAGIAAAAITGSVSGSLPHLTGSSAGTVSAPSFTGVVAATLPPLSGAVAGTVDVPVYSGVVAPTLPPLTGSAAGTYTPGTVTGVVAPTLPPLAGTAAGTHTSNDQAGEVAATLPALTGSVVGDYTAPPSTGVVAGTLPPLTGTVAGSILNPVTGTVGATLPPLTVLVEAGSDRTGSVTATLPALSGSITGTAGVAPEPIDDEASPVDDEDDTGLPTLAIPPTGFVERPIMRRSVIVPDLSAYPKDPTTGQPHVTDAEYATWEADAIEEEIGVPHLIFPDIDDPNDVTYYRGMPVQGLRFLRREPFGDADADATIPGITSMDTHPDDTGAPHPFTRARANMEFVLKKSDGTVRRLWSGNVFTRSLGNDGRQPTMGLHALGSLYMADSTRNRPVVSDNPLDYGYLIPRAFNLVSARRYKGIAHITTNILTRERGAWSDSPMGFALDGLAKCWLDDGSNQWTIAKVVGSRRQYEMRLKKTDPEWTFTNGARGVYVDLEEDDNGRNIVFGHGVNTDGGIWFNTKYPDNGGVIRRPLAADPRTQKWLFDDDGNITGTNPVFDGNVLPREDDVDFGQNSKAIGIRSAQQIVDRESVPSFVGRITVETDPREGWRGDIQAGDKLTLIGYQGRDLILHVTDVEVSLDGSMPVTLTVDERSRDAMTVAQIRDRNKEARRDPALRPGNPNRRSRLEQDQIVPFDSESKAGRIAPFFATGGAWTIVSVPFATAGRIAKVHFDMGSPTCAGLFAIRPSQATLNALIGNPQTQDDPLKAHMNTLENDYGLCAFWGQQGQRMGYSPGREDASDPFTGDFDEATGFDYVAQANARLYLAVYAASSTTVSGRCYPALVV